ncbi:unnamed protein product, partial [Symbiodinium microadriaticum]
DFLEYQFVVRWKELLEGGPVEELLAGSESTLSLEPCRFQKALVKFPPFKEGGSLLDYTLAYERLLNEYQKVAPHPYDDNLKISTLLAGLPADIRRYLQLSMDKDVTYEKLRTRLLSYERTTAAWSSEHVLRSIGIDKDAAKFVDTGGLAPMDVDRVEDKGKGKKGDKGKGKKGGKDGGRPSLGNKP